MLSRLGAIMARLVGLYRELRDNEHAIVEDGILTPTVFIKEVECKKLLGSQRREFPILYLMSNVYLTNKRLMFLVLHEVEAMMLRKRGIPTLTGIEGSWYEIPLTAIRGVAAIKKEIKRDKNYKEMLSNLFTHEHLSLIEISYEGERASGGLRDYVKSIFDAEGMAKIFNVKNIIAMSDKIHMLSDQAISLVPKIKSLCSQ